MLSTPSAPALHATAVQFAGAGMLLCGPSGAGKSDLALRLIEAGGRLIADDYCHLRRDDDGTLFARCPLALTGRLEIRGLGVVNLPYCIEAPIHLGFDLLPRERIERLPEIEPRWLMGGSVPFLPLDGFAVTAVIKVRLAVGLILEDELRLL